MNLILTVINGTTEGSTIAVAAGECLTFGRTTAAQKSFPLDTHMSSLHFEIENFGPWAELRDKRSTNGTWLNNNRISASRLSDGDQIRAGTTLFSVQYRPSSSIPHYPPNIFVEPSEPDKLVTGDLRRDPITFAPLKQYPLENDFPNPSSEAGKGISFPHGNSLGGVGQVQDQIPGNFPVGSVFSSEAAAVERQRLIAEDSPGKLLDDVHRHLDKKLNPFGDSIDISDMQKEERVQSIYVPAQMESRPGEPCRISPISDSSIIVPSAFGHSQQPAERHAEYWFFNRRLTTSLAEGLAAIVESLSREYSVQVVTHPQKIRQAIPKSCETMQELWSCYGQEVGFGPIAIPWLDFKQIWHPFLERLGKSDAIIFFFGEDLKKMQQRLKELPMMTIAGFSEAGGFLNCFWPSSMSVILNSRGTRVCNELFEGKISGLVMPSPIDDTLLLAAANKDLRQSLHEVGFQLTNNLLGG